MGARIKRAFFTLMLVAGTGLTLFGALSIGPIMAPLSEVKEKQQKGEELLRELSRLYDIRAGEMETFLSRRSAPYPSEETRAQVKFKFGDLIGADQAALNAFDRSEQLALQWMSEQIQECLQSDCAREKWFARWHRSWIHIERQLAELRMDYVKVGIEHRQLLRRIPKDVIELMGLRSMPLFRMEFSHLKETLALDSRGIPIQGDAAPWASRI